MSSAWRKTNNFIKKMFFLKVQNKVNYSLSWCFKRKILQIIYKNMSVMSENPINIFDRSAKTLQKQRQANGETPELYDYLKAEIGERLADRIYDIKREFYRVLDLGCGRGYVTKHITSDCVKEVICMDTCDTFTKQTSCDDSEVKLTKIVGDEERLGDFLETNSVDLVISNLTLHWINDLPLCFEHVMKILKPDGVFIASIFGGDTLFELRSSLQLAELERLGGLSPHISPFTRVRDIGGLLSRAGFTMQTIDTEEITVGYPSMLDVMLDLKGMAEGNCAWNRKLNLRKDVTLAASAIYNELYGKEEDGKFSVPATFQVLYLVGWKPDPSQPQPLERGTGQISLKDLYKLDEIIKERGTIPTEEK